MSGELPEKETVRGDLTKEPRDLAADDVDKRAATSPAREMAQPAAPDAAHNELVETAANAPSSTKSATEPKDDEKVDESPRELEVPEHSEDMRRVPGP